MVVLPGWTFNETTFAAFTVAEIFPETVPDVAETFTVPVPVAVAIPLLSRETILGSVEVHETLAVRSLLEPSE